MNCIVTAGPTFEPIDRVRRITNFSTGRLGSLLAAYLAMRGHRVRLLLGEMAPFRLSTADTGRLASIATFSTAADLLRKLTQLRQERIDAVFHAAAVADFSVQAAFADTGTGPQRYSGGKIPSTVQRLVLELVPTPKIISNLRDLFPAAILVGWKYQVDGTRDEAILAGLNQILANRTNACVVNGPAYGDGFGLVTPPGHCRHLPGDVDLFAHLEEFVDTQIRASTGQPHQ